MAFLLNVKDIDSFLAKHNLETISGFKKRFNIGDMQDAVVQAYSGLWGRVKDGQYAEQDMRVFEKAREMMPEMTTVVPEAIGNELFEHILSKKKTYDTTPYYSSGGDGIGCERVLYQQADNQIKDVYLIYEDSLCYPDNRHRNTLRVMVLYVEYKNINFNFIYYTTVFTLGRAVGDTEATNPYDDIQAVIERKLGPLFIAGADSGETAVRDSIGDVFPNTAIGGGDDSVKSRCFIVNDMSVPAYISFNANYKHWSNATSKSILERYGSLKARTGHTMLGFAGICPTTFFSPDGFVLEGNGDELWTQATFVNDNRCAITRVLGMNDKSVKASTTEVLSVVGTATDIFFGDSDGLDDWAYARKQRARFGSGNQHKPHTIEKWEPHNNTAVKLSELPDVRVTRIIAEDTNDDSVPQIYFVQTETKRWYEYNYYMTPEPLKKAKDLKEFEICGATDNSFLERPHKEYIFGILRESDHWFEEYGEVGRMKALAESLGEKIKSLHGTSYLSMQNDMRAIWALCRALEVNGTI